MAAAEEAMKKYLLDKVVFIPCGKPPHKNVETLAPAEDRYLMTAMAIAGKEEFSVSRYEIDKPDLSYTVDTMKYFKEQEPEAEIFFITGADSVMELESWREPNRIFEYGYLIGATRPGYTVEKAPDIAGQVLWMEIPALGISATSIRRRIKDGEPVTYLMPDGVVEYISSRRLYLE
jgi:nicotinate-nucleotide adenylyltransferase